MNTINQYIAAAKMDHDRIRGSEVRLQCGKLLILQCTHTIPATGGIYTLHKNVNSQSDVSSYCDFQLTMHVCHVVNHNDIITSVQ